MNSSLSLFNFVLGYWSKMLLITLVYHSQQSSQHGSIFYFFSSGRFLCGRLKSLLILTCPRYLGSSTPAQESLMLQSCIFNSQLQQDTFSNYKNHNTYKGLIGISPSGAVIFVSQLYPDSISVGCLTCYSQRIQLCMADWGFDIMEDLAPLGVKLLFFMERAN